jgi:hypothetical protein
MKCRRNCLHIGSNLHGDPAGDTPVLPRIAPEGQHSGPFPCLSACSRPYSPQKGCSRPCSSQPEGLLVRSRGWRSPKASDTPGSVCREKVASVFLRSLKGCSWYAAPHGIHPHPQSPPHHVFDQTSPRHDPAGGRTRPLRLHRRNVPRQGVGASIRRRDRRSPPPSRQPQQEHCARDTHAPSQARLIEVDAQARGKRAPLAGWIFCVLHRPVGR